MSEMEFLIGSIHVYGKIDKMPGDVYGDEWYRIERAAGLYLVAVDDIVYTVIPLADLNRYSFQEVIDTSKIPNIIVAYWYNGGGGVHEVAEEAIREWLEK